MQRLENDLRVVVKLGYKNAFNMVKRCAMSDTKRVQLMLHPFSRTMVNQLIFTLVNVRWLLGRLFTEATHLGQLLYGIATLPMAKDLKSELKLLYLDDTTLGKKSKQRLR